jgi:hypothetical protein
MADLLSVPVLTKAPATAVLTTPSRSAGSNQGGVGYVATYGGISGAVPVGADPDEGEALTGSPTVHVWMELTHVHD